MSKHDDLGDRMKSFENSCGSNLLPRMPVMVRVDGRSFSKFTKGFNKPFDTQMIKAMQYATTELAKEIQGFKIAYTQSDEASFVFTDYDDFNMQGWFGYKMSKIISTSAAIMSVRFNEYMQKYTTVDKLGTFDSRAFNVPRHEVANALLWRAKDWHRNSLSMYSRSMFSHKELIHKNSSDIHAMLESNGKDWDLDLADVEKYGTFIVKGDTGLFTRTDIRPNYSSIMEMVGDWL